MAAGPDWQLSRPISSGIRVRNAGMPEGRPSNPPLLKKAKETIDIREINEDLLSRIQKNDPILVAIKLRSATCSDLHALFSAMSDNLVARSLDISFIAIGDEEFASLSKMFLKNKSLQMIKLRSCCITDQGCLVIAEGLQECDAPLRLIDLANNLLTNSSAVVLERALQIQASRRSFQGPTIQVLLSGNNITEGLCLKLDIPGTLVNTIHLCDISNLGITSSYTHF